MHLCLEIRACINEPLQAHMNTYACLEARKTRDVKIFLNAAFIEMPRIYIFFLFFLFFFFFSGFPPFFLFKQIFWKLRVNLGNIFFFFFFGVRNLFELQIGWFNGLAFESKHVEGWFDLGTTQASNRVVQLFGTLNPNTLRGDLTWGLPKLQIEWFDGLESWIQTRWGVIWLGDYPSCKSSGSTVWNPESKHVEGGWFDLGTTQAANRVVQRFGILNPNSLRGDLTWGLPKLQIEWFNISSNRNFNG